MKNLMVYGKMADMKTFGAMDISAGTFPGNLLYASLIKEENFDKLKAWINTVSDNEPVVLEIRVAGTSKVLFSTVGKA